MSTATLRIRSKIYPPTKGQKKANIQAKAKVRLILGDNCLVEINDVTIWKKKDGGYFITPPNKRYEDGDGNQKKYYYVWIAPDEDMNEDGGFRAQFEKSVLSAFQKARKGGSDDEEEAPRREKPKRSNDWDDDDDDEPRKKSKKSQDFDDDDDDDEDEWI